MSAKRGYVSIRTVTKRLKADAAADAALAPALEWLTKNYPQPKNRKHSGGWGSGGGSYESHMRDEIERICEKDD